MFKHVHVLTHLVFVVVLTDAYVLADYSSFSLEAFSTSSTCVNLIGRTYSNGSLLS